MTNSQGMKNASTSLPIEIHDKFKEKAKEHETSISQLLREFVEAFNTDKLTIRKSTRGYNYRTAD